MITRDPTRSVCHCGGDRRCINAPIQPPRSWRHPGWRSPWWGIQAVFCGAKQRLGLGVVVADARPRVRGLDAQPLQHRQHRRRLQRAAVVAMKHLLGVSGGDALARPRRAVCPCAFRTQAMLDSLPRYTPSSASMGTIRAGGTAAERGSLATPISTQCSARLKAWPGMGCTACALPSPPREAVLALPTLQRARIDAGDPAGRLKPRAGAVRCFDVLRQGLAIFETDHSSSPLLKNAATFLTALAALPSPPAPSLCAAARARVP